MKIYKTIVWSVFLLAAGLLSLTQADSTKTISVTSGEMISPLVELYTSEGCSSCPPADRFLSELGDVFDDTFHAIPLAFHVDYWNYLGWSDAFADSRFTERQRQVARRNNQRSVYTPELVVTGKEARGGAIIYDEIARANRTKARVTINLAVSLLESGGLTANLDLENQSDATSAEVFFAIYENNISRQIGTGENRGKTLHHDFVVRFFSDPLTVSEGYSTNSVEMGIAEDWNVEELGMAVIVVNAETGETLQSLSTSLKSILVEG